MHSKNSIWGLYRLTLEIKQLAMPKNVIRTSLFLMGAQYCVLFSQPLTIMPGLKKKKLTRSGGPASVDVLCLTA